MIRINVFISADEAVRAKVIESASALTAASLKEEGCIAYDIFESSTRKNVFAKHGKMKPTWLYIKLLNISKNT